jgi:hypothetical protein
MSDIPHLNIDELYERKKETDSQRVSIYNKLLLKIHNKIKVASRLNPESEFCYYVMPEILIGYPNYNFQECIIYITSCLQDDGFLTRYIHPNLILISWRHWIPQYVREELKKKTGKNIDKFGNEIKESVLDRDKKVRFEQKTKEKPKYNKEYKSSGKFIYSNDVLSTIKDIL